MCSIAILQTKSQKTKNGVHIIYFQAPLCPYNRQPRTERVPGHATAIDFIDMDYTFAYGAHILKR